MLVFFLLFALLLVVGQLFELFAVGTDRFTPFLVGQIACIIGTVGLITTYFI